MAQWVKSLPDPGSIPGWRRSPREGNGNPFQYSCLENPTDKGAWQATIHGFTKSRTPLSNFTLYKESLQSFKEGSDRVEDTWTHFLFSFISFYVFLGRVGLWLGREILGLERLKWRILGWEDHFIYSGWGVFSLLNKVGILCIWVDSTVSGDFGWQGTCAGL